MRISNVASTFQRSARLLRSPNASFGRIISQPEVIFALDSTPVSESIQRFSSFSKNFSTKATTESKPKSDVPPPPPYKGGAYGMWILVISAAAGATYYFREELGLTSAEKTTRAVPQKIEQKPTETKAEKPVVVNTGVNKVEETRAQVVDAEQRLKAAGALKTENKASSPKEEAKSSEKVDWEKVRAAIVEVLDEPNFDDGSYGPVFVRLAWHHAGTFDKRTGKGGSEGAAMRFDPEMNWGANKGLDVARKRLEPIKNKFPNVTYSDLWSFAGTVALEEMGAPKLSWRPGRRDVVLGENILPNGLLPDADGREHLEKPQDHVRFIFNRMGFNDREMVALIGAHALGRCHIKNSGYDNKWTYSPTTFSNTFFTTLLTETWHEKKTHLGKPWTGPKQYENANAELMMLPSDMCLLWDNKFKAIVEEYAKDEELFLKEFGKAWTKLQENGVKAFEKGYFGLNFWPFK